MIKIEGNVLDYQTLTGQYTPNSMEKKIFDILSESSEVYSYRSIDYLKFELNLRNSIINSAVALSRSHFSFKVFRKSRCNPDFWHRTNEGGFSLESGVKPSDAIRDIYIHSSSYGTECSTAMVIVYFKALVELLPEELFNRLFPNIYLMNWQHLDSDLGINEYNHLKDYLPGDGRYFKNPDVDPIAPEWQGENVFDLSNGRYYGHGMGIANADMIIRSLNSRRKKDAQESAYLMDSAKRPNFRSLASKYLSWGQS